MKIRLSKPELIALLLYIPGKTGNIGEPIVGTTRLMKIFFLLLKEEGLDRELDLTTNFKPFRFGPFDSEVYDSIEALRELGIVEDKASQQELREMPEDVKEDYDADTEYKLTPVGIAKVQKIAEELPPEILRKIANYKIIYNDKPLVEILHYVYGKYPKYAELSEAMF